MSETYLLDTSAVLTLVEDEKGADRVEYLLRNEKVLIPFLAAMETYYVTMQEEGQAEADKRYAHLKQVRATFIWDTSEPILLTAARYKATYSVSLADALIAAFAFQNDALLVHKDPEFELLKEVRQEKLPYRG